MLCVLCARSVHSVFEVSFFRPYEGGSDEYGYAEAADTDRGVGAAAIGRVCDAIARRRQDRVLLGQDRALRDLHARSEVARDDAADRWAGTEGAARRTDLDAR